MDRAKILMSLLSVCSFLCTVTFPSELLGSDRITISSDPDERLDDECWKNDNVSACLIVGDHYEQRTDVATAYSQYWERACELGSALGCRKDAMYYGRGGALDAAVEYYQKGCALHDAVSCRQLTTAKRRLAQQELADEKRLEE